ncbi:unnamed protein product [marine sediment metagenome]|uniref:Uncharacterized protein n=1 Tax=marine sediment metagenome TaxID=412755 RepID=X1V415_9ZZZZ
MEAEVKVALHTLKELRVKGKIATLRRARKSHKCNHCGLLIEKGEEHYCVYTGGAGLYNLKFPDRVHRECITDYLNTGGK